MCLQCKDKRLWMSKMRNADQNVIEVDDIREIDQHCAYSVKTKGLD